MINRRAFLLSPLWLIAALLTFIGLGTSSAAANAGLETRVRAIPTVVETSVGQRSSETAGSVGCLRPSPAQLAVGSCVATEAAVSSGGGFGRGGQKLNPDPLADGAPHTTFRTDPTTGKVTHYTTWEPNPQNPIGYDPVKRFDGVGGSHYNKVLDTRVPTPHVQGPGIPGGVRPAEPWEIPGG